MMLTVARAQSPMTPCSWAVEIFTSCGEWSRTIYTWTREEAEAAASERRVRFGEKNRVVRIARGHLH